MTEEEIAYLFPLMGIFPTINVEDSEEEIIDTGLLDQFGEPIWRYPPPKQRMGFYLGED